MEIINEQDVAPMAKTSPKGAFGHSRRHMSLALGGKKDVGVWGGGHPFDVELTTLPAGKQNYPFHAHAAQWEYYIILAGSGRILDNNRQWHALKAGDHVVCPPGEAHLIENDGKVDLLYYVIADHYPSDVTTYPNTGKRNLKPEFKIVRITEADYYEGEE